jgi:nucleotide-binding universal stress UspA family protein
MAKQDELTAFETVVPATYTAKVRGVDFEITNIRNLPAASVRKIFEYGLQRISNDSAASAKTDEEAIQLATKRWDNLRAGVIRAAGARIGDPVKRRAMELAEAKVQAAPKFQAWLTEAKLKASDKDAVAKRRELAEKQIAVEGNPFTAQAKIDVEAAKSLTVEDLDIEI